MAKRTDEPSEFQTDTAPTEKKVKYTQGLWLDTIRRDLLDFDFEKLCCISLQNMNIYACLVCGKYYQGRGKNSFAYAHSFDADHHVFLNLTTKQVYILPEGYEETDPSLNDIKYVLDPTFTPELVGQLENNGLNCVDLNQKPYVPGYIGLNNLKANDYINVVVHALSQVTPLRRYFLLSKYPPKNELVKRFASLLCKLWNPKLFKAHVSPHEFVQQVSNASQKKFSMTEQKDSFDFLSWFLNELHVGLGGKRTPGSSIIHTIFQGQLQMESQRIVIHQFEDKKVFDQERGKPLLPMAVLSQLEIKKVTMPFLFLTLDLPPSPLFQDEIEKNIIPQVSIFDLLAKYDGETSQESDNTLVRYKILALPSYLLMVVKRFVKTNFTIQKNPTIVNYPMKGLNMREYVQGASEDTFYDLIAMISHQGSKSDGSYKVATYCKPKDEWFQIQDLLVDRIMPQMILLQESCVLVWKRQKK